MAQIRMWTCITYAFTHHNYETFWTIHTAEFEVQSRTPQVGVLCKTKAVLEVSNVEWEARFKPA